MGLNSVRILVSYFIFEDCPPFIGCREELDKASHPESVEFTPEERSALYRRLSKAQLAAWRKGRGYFY